MKYYKDPVTNELYAYEADGSQDEFIKEGLVSITEQEADVIRQENSIKLLDSLTYSEKRRVEYPSILDYLDGVVKGDQSQIDAYIAACKAVKLKYPKP